jgi:IclR family KDG regulon transcriptional repressor
MVKSAVRVLRILELIGQCKDGCLHSQIASALKIPGGSLTALLADLQELGYIYYDEKTRRYFLGAEVLSLSSAYLRNLNIVQIGEPILRDIFREIQEFTSLVIAKDTEVIKVCEYAIPDPLAYHLQVGESGPMHATAGGKALLAFMPPPLFEYVASRLEFRRYTKHTIGSREALIKELKAIRTGAIAYCREEYLEGMISMALPVFNSENQAVAAIGINTRSVRFSRAHERKVAEALRSASSKLSSRLGNRAHRSGESAHAA